MAKTNSPAANEPDESKSNTSWREDLAVATNQIRYYIYATVLVMMLLVGALWTRIFIVVPAGHHAVLFDLIRGGTDVSRIYPEGLHLIWPWNHLISYETRLQQKSIKFSVLSSEGMELNITLAIRFTAKVDSLGYLHRDIGTDYFERLIKPDIAGHLRHTFGGRPAHQIYSSAREVLQEISKVPLLGRVDPVATKDAGTASEPYVKLEELKLVDIELPPLLVTAINEKQRHEQLLLEYKYRLESEEKESERKRTEAAGVRDYSLIAGKITADVLRWRGVEAALALAKSTNSKTLILGNSPAGNPLMLNFTDSGLASGGTAAPAEAPSTGQRAPVPAPAPLPAR